MIRFLKGKEGSSSTTIPNYKQLKYIQATGTQYVNTGIVPASDVDIEISLMPIYNYWGRLVGEFNVRNQYDITNTYEAGRIAVTVNRESNRAELIIPTDKFSAIKVCGDGKIYVDGILKSTISAYSSSITNPIILFNGYDAAGTGKLGYFKIWKAGELIRDLRPCKISNLILLHDEVTDRYYENEGSGNFIAGNEL